MKAFQVQISLDLTRGYFKLTLWNNCGIAELFFGSIWLTSSDLMWKSQDLGGQLFRTLWGLVNTLEGFFTRGVTAVRRWPKLICHAKCNSSMNRTDWINFSRFCRWFGKAKTMAVILRMEQICCSTKSTAFTCICNLAWSTVVIDILTLVLFRPNHLL